MSSALDRLLARLDHVRPSGSGWESRCPLHDDPARSMRLSIDDDGRLQMYCEAADHVAEEIIGEALAAQFQELWAPDPDGFAAQLRAVLDEAAERSRGESPDDAARATGAVDGDERKSQADMLVTIGSRAELFHDNVDDAYAAISVDGHREIHKLGSKRFKVWLRKQYWDEYEKAPGNDAVNSALGVLEGIGDLRGRPARAA